MNALRTSLVKGLPGLLVVFWLFAAVGCWQFSPISDETRFYVLKNPGERADRENPVPVEVRLARFLENPALALREGVRIHYLHRDRWAEPLPEALKRFFRDLPGGPSGQRLILEIDFLGGERVGDESFAVLEARYQWVGSETSPAVRAFTRKKSWRGADDPGELVSLLQEALTELAEKIAKNR